MQVLRDAHPPQRPQPTMLSTTYRKRSSRWRAMCSKSSLSASRCFMRPLLVRVSQLCWSGHTDCLQGTLGKLKSLQTLFERGQNSGPAAQPRPSWTAPPSSLAPNTASFPCPEPQTSGTEPHCPSDCGLGSKFQSNLRGSDFLKYLVQAPYATIALTSCVPRRATSSA